MLQSLILLSLAALACTSSRTRILGGTVAETGEFPHLGFLDLQNQHRCSCILAGEFWVITAAHCIEGTSANNLRVTFGVSDKNEDGQRVNVDNFVIHPQYEAQTPFPYDIAVMELRAPGVDLSDPLVEVANITSLGVDYPFGDTVIAGWGSTESGVEGDPIDVLMRADMEALSQERCREHWTGVDQIRDVHICAFDSDEISGLCSGDAGSPLNWEDQVIGVASWGAFGCWPQYPHVFARTSQFCDWFPSETDGIVNCN